MSSYRECDSRDSCDDAREERAELEKALRALWETLYTFNEGGKRVVGIPNLEKFWQAYDAAERVL